MAKSTTQEVEVSKRDELLAVAAAAIAEMRTEEFDAEQMMLDILEATSLDEALAQDVRHLKDVIGIPFTVLGAELQTSKFDASFIPLYAVIRAEFDDGTKCLLTTGAAQVIAVLIAAQSKGWFPFRIVATSTTASSGNDVIKFAKPTA